MGRAIDYHAEVPDMAADAREPHRNRLVPRLWWVLRDAFSEIKAELRLIIG